MSFEFADREDVDGASIAQPPQGGVHCVEGVAEVLGDLSGSERVVLLEQQEDGEIHLGGP